MRSGIEITADERRLLKEALAGPLLGGGELDGPVTEETHRRLQRCLNLCARRLLQPAAAQPGLRGWRAPLCGFLLTRQGWAVLKAERRRARPRPAAGGGGEVVRLS